MRLHAVQSAFLSATLILCAHAADVFQDALAALARGDFAAAVQKLRPQVAAHPEDARSLSLLAVALDNQNQFAEAAAFHRRAVAAAPRSADILGNYGNHLLATGAAPAARDAFLKAIALEPANANANLQLARQAVQRKQGSDALRYLQHLPAAQLDSPPAALVQLDALYLAGETARADALATKLSATAQGDAALSFSLALLLAAHQRFERSETLFTRALAAAPADFNVQFNLGAVAASAGHYERAREVLEAARKQQPDNVELLFRLAGAYYELQQWQSAASLLAHAAKLDPQRADVQKLLALTTTSLGALDDALAAWDAYLKLAPADEIARRDRAYITVRMGQLENGIAELERFLARHPDDAAGQFQLGMALSQTDAAKGLSHLSRAVALQPDFSAALSARGALYYQQGKPDAALPDLEAAAKLRPLDAINLDRLGQTYLALDRIADAVSTLRNAAALVPEESRIQLHFARALADAGDTAESRQVMDRFRQLGPATKNGVPAGFIDFLAMNPVQRRADYRARVEKSVRERPDDPAAHSALLKLHLEDGDLNSAEAEATQLTNLKTPPQLLADSGRALLQAGRYAAAVTLLTNAEGAAADLAIARAQLLDAGGRHQDALAALQPLTGSALPLELRSQAAAILLRNDRPEDALALFNDAAEPEPLLIKAVLLAASGQTPQAATIVEDVQSRRPEWFAVWVARAILRPGEQRAAALETAVALGARSQQVRDALTGKATLDPKLLLDRLPRDW